MVTSSRTLRAHVIIINFLLLLSCNMVYGTPTDIFCLKSIKNSLEDPYGYLYSSWDFNNNTDGFICGFTGVECWHPDENKVLNLKLSNMGLKGQFPRAIQNCSSLTGLDLSINKLSGTIPADIGNILGYVTDLDLSSNDFSGTIPVGLANCSYVNSLKLDQNHLTGQIPGQFSTLSRLKIFNVTNNLLTGQIPNLPNISVDSYANNPGLCGSPLPACQAPSSSSKSNSAVIAGAGAVGVAVGALAIGIGLFFFARRVFVIKKEEDPEGNKWARSLKGTEGIKPSQVAGVCEDGRETDECVSSSKSTCSNTFVSLSSEQLRLEAD
ncbi:hypothetical protein K1719_042369 [Acacia pycnantha]|nr:hypothetical protein K1719_042369 [Acacia pycnantha]